MKLRYYHTLGTVEDERTTLGHIGDKAEVYILNDLLKVLMLGVGTVETKLGFQGYTICQTTLQTLLDGVAGLVDIVVDELQNEVVSGICDREILVEHLIEALVLAILGGGVQLEEISE